MERLLAGMLLALALGGIALFLRGDRAEWQSFKALNDTADRQRRYRRWAVRLWLFFALPAIIGLSMMGKLPALVLLPPELGPAAALLPRLPVVSGDLLSGLAGGVAIGIAVLVIMARLRGGKIPKPVGDVAAILPRNRAELRLAAWLSVSAGITEEIAFRLFLPLLIAIVTGSATFGAATAIALFGAMHLYQGWAGIFATSVIGGVLTFCYLATGALWVVIALHALVDLGGLVIRPLLAGAWRA